jgi:A/G-specific adenine glycosylase
LAIADEDEVLRYWQGLGYYSRARNLHKTAQIITEKHEGIFPKNHSDILLLKGIGEYTAAAISSFAYNQPFAVVDGNVFRVLARVFGIAVVIEQGEGHFMFEDAGDKVVVGRFRSNIVEVNHISDLDVNQWVEEFRTLLTHANSFGD